MEKTKRPPELEIVFGSADTRISTRISRDVRAGRLRRIAPKLYTSNLGDAPASIVQRNLYAILGHHYPKAVISHRSALEGGLGAADKTLFSYSPLHAQGNAPPGSPCACSRAGARRRATCPSWGAPTSLRQRALLENLQPARAIGNSQNLAQEKDRGLPRQQCPDSRRQVPEPYP